MQALGDHYRFKIFSRNCLEDTFFDDVDMIVFPGGLGDSDSFYSIVAPNEKRIKQFVQEGGRYLGICMGAYWAGSNYFDILDGVDAVQYLKRPGADTHRPHAKNISINWQGQPMSMFWYDGCALVGDPSKFKTVATYINGDPMAIVQNRIGLIGCHPESEQFWYDGYSWMRPHWHERKHHQLLLEFVDQLISSN
jgi:hypothetical protein